MQGLVVKGIGNGEILVMSIFDYVNWVIGVVDEVLKKVNK